MKRLNVVDFYEIGIALNRLGTLINAAQKTTPVDAFYPVSTATNALDKFAEQDAFQLARGEASTFGAALRNFTEFFDFDEKQGRERCI